MEYFSDKNLRTSWVLPSDFCLTIQKSYLSECLRVFAYKTRKQSDSWKYWIHPKYFSSTYLAKYSKTATFSDILNPLKNIRRPSLRCFQGVQKRKTRVNGKLRIVIPVGILYENLGMNESPPPLNSHNPSLTL